MKKYLIIIVIVAVFVIYVVYRNISGSSVVPATSALGDQTVPVSTSTPVADTPPSSGSTTGKYKDGTYTGTVADAFYGKVQVAAVIQNGLLADVTFLQFPKDQGESLQVSNHSLPILKSEAIQSQSARVDVVSGATQTSQAFTQSLSAALSSALNS